VFRRPGQGAVLQDGILRYSAARRSRNQNGPRLWSKTQPQRVGIAAMLRLVLRRAPKIRRGLQRFWVILIDWQSALQIPPRR